MIKKTTARDLRAERTAILKEAAALVAKAEAEERDLNDAEQAEWDAKMADADLYEKRALRLEQISGFGIEGEDTSAKRAAPAVLKIGRGDTEERAYAHYIRTGDESGLTRFGERFAPVLSEARASNDTTMNITTAADGGYAVPTGHYKGIIARRDEGMLANKLGVRNIPGIGTTVNVPLDGEDDGEFVVTTESNAFDRDAPAVGQKAMTLAMYTKKVDLTYQLLNDEDSRLLAFLEDFVGRGAAKTHNNLLLTEVAANGTALKTFASATVIAVDELEPIVYNDALDPYLDDSASSAWVMRRTVHGEILLLDDANTRRYAPNAQGGPGPNLLGFPIAYSYKSGATAASAKSVYFGNWNFVGKREPGGMSMIRDPYTRAGYGEVILYYHFFVVYGVLQAEAIGYGVHPSA